MFINYLPLHCTATYIYNNNNKQIESCKSRMAHSPFFVDTTNTH